MTTLSDLPAEIILHCTQYLRIYDIYCLLQTNKYLYSVTIGDNFYEKCKNFYKKNKTKLCFDLVSNNICFNKFIQLYHEDLNIWLLFKKICQLNNLEKAQIIYERFLKGKILKLKALCRSMCKLGHLQIAKWLHSLSPVCMDTHVLQHMVTCGHLEMFKWAILSTPLRRQMHETRISHYILDESKKINIEIFKWANENPHIFEIDTNLFTYACVQGSVELMLWLQELDPIKFNAPNVLNLTYRVWHPYAIRQLIESNQLQEIQTIKFNPEEFLFSCVNVGDIELIKWANTKYGIGLNQKVFDIAVQRGDIRLVQWVNDNYQINIDNVKAKNLLINAYIAGHLTMAEWIQRNYQINLLHHEKKELFLKVCQKACIDTAKFLFDIWVELRDQSFLRNLLDSLHKIEIIKWIFELCNIQTNTKYISNRVIFHCFHHACINNDVKFASLLLRHHHIIIQNNNHYDTFRMACKLKHLEMAKWLYQHFEIDIREDSDNIFRTAVKCVAYHILDWLCSICSCYSYYSNSVRSRHIDYSIKEDSEEERPHYLSDWIRSAMNN